MPLLGTKTALAIGAVMYQGLGETRGFFATQQAAGEATAVRLPKMLENAAQVWRSGQKGWGAWAVEFVFGVKPAKKELGWSDVQQAVQSVMHPPRPPRYLMVAWAGMAGRLAMFSILLGGTMVLLSAIV